MVGASLAMAGASLRAVRQSAGGPRHRRCQPGCCAGGGGRHRARRCRCGRLAGAGGGVRRRCAGDRPHLRTGPARQRFGQRDAVAGRHRDGCILLGADRFPHYIASESELQSLVFWQMGSLARANWADVAAVVPLFAIGVFALQRLATPLDMLALGERQAQHLGWMSPARDVGWWRSVRCWWAQRWRLPARSVSLAWWCRTSRACWSAPGIAGAAAVRPAGCAADRGGRHRCTHARPAGRDSAGPVLGRAGRTVLPLAGAAAAPQGGAMSVL